MAQVWAAHACSVLAMAFCHRELYFSDELSFPYLAASHLEEVRARRMRAPARCKRALPRIRTLRADAHRHQHIKEWRLDLQHARAHFIDQIEKYFVLGQVSQRRH